MTIGAWLSEMTGRLQHAGVTSARLDCLIILEDCLRKDRSHLLAHTDMVLSRADIHRLDAQVRRRSKYEPLAYIRGFTEFYGRKFFVNNNVLIPRPETECIIELLKALITTKQLSEECKITDVGTGSGCLALTAKLELPGADVTAIDIDSKCLLVARRNARSLGAKITFCQGNLLQDHRDLCDVVLANLPYLATTELHSCPDIQYEPNGALYGGFDGLKLYRELLDQMDHVNRPMYLIAESEPHQHEKLSKECDLRGYRLLKESGLTQLFCRVEI